MNNEWSGFYGPSYRLMLEHSDLAQLPDEIWDSIVKFHAQNPTKEGHWEFLALGYLLLFDRTEVLSTNMKLHLSIISTEFNSNHNATNWRLITQIVKRRIESKKICMADLNEVRLKQLNNGFLQDIPGDQSSQYHAFLLFLVMRFSCPTDLIIRTNILKGFDWLINNYKRYGDPSPLGRGRFQLFGYAAMAAAANLAKKWDIQLSDSWLTSVWSHLQATNYSGSISPNWDGPHRNFLLHGYNTVDDYPAFFSLIMHQSAPKSLSFSEKKLDKLWWHPLDKIGSGLLADKFGVQIGIISSKIIEQPSNRMNSIKKLIRSEKSTYIPLPVYSDTVLPGNDFKIDTGSNSIKLSLNIENSSNLISEYTIWSTLKHSYLNHSGSVEIANTEWKKYNSKNWMGLDLRIVRIGSVSIIWKWK